MYQRALFFDAFSLNGPFQSGHIYDGWTLFRSVFAKLYLKCSKENLEYLALRGHLRVHQNIETSFTKMSMNFAMVLCRCVDDFRDGFVSIGVAKFDSRVDCFGMV